jgi:hypothetical protein
MVEELNGWRKEQKNRRTEEQWVQIKILNLLPESWDSMIGRSKTL